MNEDWFILLGLFATMTIGVGVICGDMKGLGRWVRDAIGLGGLFVAIVLTVKWVLGV